MHERENLETQHSHVPRYSRNSDHAGAKENLETLTMCLVFPEGWGL